VPFFDAHSGLFFSGYDSRILTFENQREQIQYPSKLYFVDLKEVFSTHFELEGKKSLSRYHEVFAGAPITSAHTAVADSKALYTLLQRISEPEVRSTILLKRETANGVKKRCFKV